MNYRYKQSGVWLTTKEPNHSIVDCILEGSMMAYAFNDYEVLEVHTDLLRVGLRWPVELTLPTIWRSITSMTRDPFITHWFACWKLNRKQFIEITPLPWWLRRRYAHAFWKYLKSDLKDKRQLRIFERNLKRLLWWGSKTEKIRIRVFASKRKLIKQLHHVFGINAYSLHLWCLMAHVSESRKAKDMLQPFIPEWNLFCWLLTEIGSVDEYEIYDHIPQKGYPWTNHFLRTDRPLDTGDQYPLDKQLLIKLAFGD